MFEKRPTLCYEDKYTFVQSPQISSQTGLIGYLRGELDKYGRFFSFWFDITKDLKYREFKDEFDSVINELREEGGILHNKISLDTLCYEMSPAKMDTDGVYYGFRVDSESYIYLFRVTPEKGDYNVYCFCYKKKWLDYHMKEALQKGVRFFDTSYNVRFRVEDGDKIIIRCRDGTTEKKVVRYIDPYHFEVGLLIYHAQEFAEKMERIGATVRPAEEGE